jgi:stearoyl-CoA desaturase (delta-9 desaturase)
MVATTPVPSIQRDGRPPDPRPGSKPLLEGRRPTVALAALWVFIVGPFLALLAAVPVAWGWGLSWLWTSRSR